jgi:hypothetical protein
MKTPYQPYSLDTTHLVPVSRIGNRPITPATTTPSSTTATPRTLDATVLPNRVIRSTQRGSTPKRPARSTTERIVIGLKVLAAVLATAAAAALVWLIYLAVMAVIAFITAVVAWVSAHLFLIGAVIIGLLFFGGSGAACAGIHCGGCKG